MQVRVYLGESEEENFVLRALHKASGGVLTSLYDYEPSDVAVVMGTYKKHVPKSYQRGKVIESQKDRNLNTVILETGYLNRGGGPNHHYAVGLNGINGRADFRNSNSPPDRMEKLGVFPRDWKNGEHIVLCGQVPWDASVDFSNHIEWLHLTARELIKLGRLVIFRPHPLCKLKSIPGTIYSTRSLENDLKDAFSCVTFNSNSGVESVMDGVPTLAFDMGSMAYAVSGHSFEEVIKPDRTQWLSNLCYAQWLPSEMGEAWEHLRLT